LSLKKVYGEKVVVDNVSFGIDDVTNIGFLGPNGAGKSTTINMMINRTLKTNGELSFKNHIIGKSIFSLFSQDNYIFNQDSFGIVNQNNSVWENISARKIIRLFCTLNNINEYDLKELIKYFEFEHNMEKKVSELSSGN